MENKLKAKSHSTRSSKSTILPLSISHSTGEAGIYGIRIAELGKQSLMCNLGRDTTTLNSLKIKSHSGRSGSNVMPMLMWHRDSRFGAYRPGSPCTKPAQQHAAGQSTNRLQCKEHPYITEHTQETRIAAWTSIHLHPGSQWPVDDVWKGEPKGKSLGSVFWTPLTGWGIWGFSRPNEGIPSSPGLAMVQGKEPENRLD